MLLRVHHPFLLWEGCNQAAKSRYNTRLAQLLPRHIYSPCVVNWNVLNQICCSEVIDEMLATKLCVAGTDEDIFTSEARTRAFNINEPIYSELCHKFYSTYEFDKVCADDELRTKKIIKFWLCGRAFSGLHSDEYFNAREYWLSIGREENLSLSRSHASTIRNPVFRALDTTTLRELIDSEGRLIPEVLEPRVPRVAIPRPPRASMQDLYERIVFENMAGVYNVLVQGAYNPPGYDQQQQQLDDDE
ncbi:hypothetical protein Tco_0373703 [Tanacetum coccineum]